MCAAGYLARRSRTAEEPPFGLSGSVLEAPGVRRRRESHAGAVADGLAVIDHAAMAKGSTVRFCMNLPRELHARLRRAAERDRRSMADFVIVLVEQRLAESDADAPRR